MPIFEYKARDKTGTLTKGLMDAPSRETVATKLRSTGYVPTFITKKAKKLGTGTIMARFKRVTPTDLNMFTRLLLALVKAGVPLLGSLRAIAEQIDNPHLKDTLMGMAVDIEGGESFANALRKYPKVFSSIYVGMVGAGEASGTLPAILERLAILGEREEETRRMVKAATRYPMLVIGSLVAAFFVVVIFVLPRFVSIFTQVKATLPLPTRMLLGINHVVKHYWPILILIVIALLFIFRTFIRTKFGEKQWDAFKLKVPIFGPLMIKVHMSRFTRITGNLVSAGIPIIRIFELVSASVGNVIIANTLSNIREDIIGGQSISEPMRTSNMFPPVVVQMVSIGEESGKIDELLLQVADYYDRQVDYIVKNLGTYIEPILLLVLGCGVLFMALAVFLPMWDMVSVFKR